MSRTVAVTAFGETRDVELRELGADRLESVGLVVVGKFPTGTKLHRTNLTLWKRDLSTGRRLTGPTAAIVDGVEYVADSVLYIHNSNRGRLIAWNDEAYDALLAKWR